MDPAEAKKVVWGAIREGIRDGCICFLIVVVLVFVAWLLGAITFTVKPGK